MKNKPLTENDKLQPLVPHLILGTIALAFGIHVFLFLFYAAPSPLEGGYQSQTGSLSAFSTLMAAWKKIFGGSPFSARLPSAFSAMAVIFLVSRIVQRWSSDQPASAALPLGLVLFPTAAYVFALATPHALTTLLFVSVLHLAQLSRTTRPQIVIGAAGILCALIPYLHVAGLSLSVVCICLVIVQRGINRETLVFAATAVISFVALSLIFAIPFGARTGPLSLGVISGALSDASVFKSYAMIWVAQAFSAIALIGSRPLRDLLGRSGLHRSVVLLAGFAFVSGWVSFVHDPSVESAKVAFSAVLIVGVLAALPMVMWVRLVMPKLQSIFIWIALPVIMYSCFWVILGPVDLNGFPYDQLMPTTIISGAQSPR
jgi:hypothetical protein